MDAAQQAAFDAAARRARQRGQRLPAAAELMPLGQGELDGLCGLYAALNALRLVAQGRGITLSEERSHALFQHGATVLDARGKLSAAVRYGLRWRLWLTLVDELAAKAARLAGGPIPVERPFAGIDDLSELLFVSNLRALLRDRKAVLMLLKGSYEHYTVVSGLTPTRLLLFDSYGYRWVTLAACATTGDIGSKRHRVHLPSLLAVGP